MCGRFNFWNIAYLKLYFQQYYGFHVLLDDIRKVPPRPDFLPWNDISTVVDDGEDAKLISMFWNLVPASSKTFDPHKTWFNTRKSVSKKC